MSNLSIKRLQVGNSTAGNNFVIAQPDVADGTMRIYNGNIGSVTEKLRIDSAGRVICANGGSVNSNLTATDVAFMFDYEPSRNAWPSTASDGVRTHALHVRTPVLDATNVDAIVIAESGGQSCGRNSLAFWNEDFSGGTGYRKARIYTEVGPSYTATAFYIDVADSARNMQNRLSINTAGVVRTPGGLSTNTITNASGTSAIDVNKLSDFASRYIRNVFAQVNTTTYNFTTTWAAGPVFTNVTGFKAGSLVEIQYHMPCRNDSTSWGGMYIEPQVSFNSGTTWFSLGSSGYDGGIMHLNSGDIGSYGNVILVNPGQTSDFSLQIRFYFRSYDGTSTLNGSHDLNNVSGTANGGIMSGNNGTQHYASIKVKELAIMRGAA